jgi:hypothetical protein
LTTKVIAGFAAINLGQAVRYGASQGRGAEGEIKLENGLSSSLLHLVALHAHDWALESSRADQLLFHPGWLPDQQTKGVGSDAAGLIAGPQLVEVMRNFRWRELERGLKRELRRHAAA